jgi:RNA polymerase sigma-70 factor, ECF subfamily
MAGAHGWGDASKHDARPARGIAVLMNPPEARGADMTTMVTALNHRETAVPGGPDAQSRAWITDLRSSGRQGDQAVARLHELLLRAARFEVNRRRAMMPHLRGNDFDDLAMQSADDALVAVLSKLDSYRGDSKFTTWAYKFALLEAAVNLQRRAWQGREVPLDPQTWPLFAAKSVSPEASAERSELLSELQKAISDQLTAHQREVLVATTMNGVPIDVLAERLNTTRGALYKTLHDARHKLRAQLAAQRLSIGDEEVEEA